MSAALIWVLVITFGPLESDLKNYAYGPYTSLQACQLARSKWMATYTLPDGNPDQADPSMEKAGCAISLPVAQGVNGP
jgi:hypothetical protein